MPPRKKPTTTPKAKGRSSKTTSTRQKNTEPGKSKPKTTPKATKPTAKTSGKTTTKTPPKKKTTQKKPKSKPTFKRKELPPEQMFPFETFPFRLEYKDGNDTRICHFQCEDHRNKYITRYKLRKGTYFIDTAS